MTADNSLVSKDLHTLGNIVNVPKNIEIEVIATASKNPTCFLVCPPRVLLAQLISLSSEFQSSSSSNGCDIDNSSLVME